MKDNVENIGKDSLTGEEYLTACTLTDLISHIGGDKELRYKLAEARDETVCCKSGLGAYRCTVKVPFATHWCCDLCLESELYDLWRAGVHTVSSCCGHGIVPAYIQVLHGESVQKMHELGYIEEKNESCPDNPDPVYRPKTYLPCFIPCKDCAKSEPRGDGYGFNCTEDDYDTELDTFWCFTPKVPDIEQQEGEGAGSGEQ